MRPVHEDDTQEDLSTNKGTVTHTCLSHSRESNKFTANISVSAPDYKTDNPGVIFLSLPQSHRQNVITASALFSVLPFQPNPNLLIPTLNSKPPHSLLILISRNGGFEIEFWEEIDENG